MLRRSIPLRVFSSATVGSSISDFKCLRFEPSLSDLADPNGNPLEGTLWVHNKTQTQVFFFSAKEASSSTGTSSSSNTDNNNNASSLAGEKACAIAFCTPPENDSGATHILEHTVLCGSEKFPEVRDPFFKMLRRSLSTFMNAMTSPDSTFYPFSTVNEQDFFNILDVYLDCTLHPLIRPLDFAQEAHRLKVPTDENNNNNNNNKSIKLERTGVVLNEMKGALSDPMTWFQNCLFKHCHSGSAYSRCFGGAPLAIPELQHPDLVRYYGRHYQRPIVAIYDSSITSAEAKKAFLEKSLSKILTEVEKPRQVLKNYLDAASSNPNKDDSSSTLSAIISKDADDGQIKTPLEKLSELRQQQNQHEKSLIMLDDETSSLMNKKFAFMYGPPDPVSASLEEQGLSSARLGFFLPLENIIQNKVLATRDDHKEMFKLQLALHILLRPPSGPLYKALLLNPQNTKALQTGDDISLVMKRTEELLLLGAKNTNNSETAKESEESNNNTDEHTGSEEDPSSSSSSTIDLIPGSGLDHTAQTPALFIGVQNVPVTISSEKDCESLCLAKSELLSAIIYKCLEDVAATGMDQDLVESALHEFELSLRVRDKMSAVNSTISSTSAVMRGLDPFYSHSATDLDKEISADVLKCTTTVANNDNKKQNTYFSRLLKEHIITINNSNSNNSNSISTKLTAVVGSSKYVQDQANDEKKALEELSKSITADDVETAKKLDADLLEAQKRVDDGGSLPTLNVSDISTTPINFTAPTVQEKNIQTYVTNTAGLVYVRFMFPIPEEFFVVGGGDNNNNEIMTVLLPLFTSLFAQLGHLDKSIAEQDISVRKVCSGFSGGPIIASVPSNDGNQTSSLPVVPNLRAVQIGFHCMPENLDKSLKLLQDCIDSNCNGLWTEKLPADSERKAMLYQLVTMIASDLEGRVTHEGTKFATSGALESIENLSSTFSSWSKWSGMPLVKNLSTMKDAIAQLSNDGKDPSEAVSHLFPVFQQLARGLFSGNPNSFSYVVCGPNDQNQVKSSVEQFMNKSLPNLLHLSSSASGSSNTPRLIIDDDPSLYSIVKNNNNSSSKSNNSKTITQLDLPNSDGSSFVGCVLPTALSLRHELSPALRLALQIASQEYLHREIREIGGAYGCAARLGVGDLSGVSGIVSFGSYRDPSPQRTIDIFRSGGIYRWFKDGSFDKRMLQEAKLSLFGGLDAPLVPHEVAERVAVAQFDFETFSGYRKRLLDVSVDDVVRSVEEHLKPEDTEKMMSVCVLGKK